jgi:hypothetical protein
MNSGGYQGERVRLCNVVSLVNQLEREKQAGKKGCMAFSACFKNLWSKPAQDQVDHGNVDVT